MASERGARARAGLSRRRVLAGGAAMAALAAGGRAPGQPAVMQSPAPVLSPAAPPEIPAPRDDTVDVLHGVSVPDPFRPLEDLGRADVKAWIAFEDARARQALESLPVRTPLLRFLAATGRYPRAGALRRAGGHFVNFAFDGVAEHRWLEIRDRLGGPPRKLLDPVQLGPDGSVAIWGYQTDRTGSKIAYLTHERGGDAQTLRIRDIRTGQDLLDRLEGCRWTSIAWLPEGNAFYYSRPAVDSDPPDWDRKGHLLFLHQIGYPQSADRMVFRFRSRTNVYMHLRANHASGQLIMAAGIGTSEKRGLWVAPVANANLLTMLGPMGRSQTWSVRDVGAVHYVITDHEAPRGRLVKMVQSDPRPAAWETVVPEGEGVIDGAELVGDRLVVRHYRNLGHTLTIYKLDGQKQAEVALDGRVRVQIERPDAIASELDLEVDDRRRPLRIERLNVLTGKLETVSASRASHDIRNAVVRDVEAVSKDGTRVPVTLMHLPDAAPDGESRTLLYGYGSYGISQHPGYSTVAAAWLRLGGVYAVAHIRGGREFGRDWHDAGRFAKKQNAVDDFCGAANWLLTNGITRPDRLGIYGASSGGRLVLTALAQRPEMFGAVVAGVPLVDMLRFPRHTFGQSWIQEYGDPANPEDFRWLIAHSPLHNVRPGRRYPPLLILTADNDQRVAPSHGYKFAATLRSIAPEAEIYVRTRAGCGHGQGNSYSAQLALQADLIAFLVAKLGGPVRELPAVVD